MARRLSIIHREHLLLAGLIVVIAAFFSQTTFAAHAYHHRGKGDSLNCAAFANSSVMSAWRQPPLASLRSAISSARCAPSAPAVPLATIAPSSNLPIRAKAFTLQLAYDFVSRPPGAA
jgi:hypothetical protein